MSPVQGCPNLTNGPARLSRKCTAGKPVGATAANTCDIFATLVNVTQKVMCCQAAFETVDEWWFFHLTNNNVESFGRGIACFSRLWCHNKNDKKPQYKSSRNYVSCLMHFLLLGCFLQQNPASFTWKKTLNISSLKNSRYSEGLNSLQVTGRLVTTGGADGRGSQVPRGIVHVSSDQKTAVVCWCILYIYIYTAYMNANIIPLKVKIAPKIVFIFQGLYSQVPC